MWQWWWQLSISTWIGSAAAAMAGVLVLRQRLSGNKGAFIHVSQSKQKMEDQYSIVMQEIYQNPTWQGRQRQRAGTSSPVCKYHNIDNYDTVGALQTWKSLNITYSHLKGELCSPNTKIGLHCLLNAWSFERSLNAQKTKWQHFHSLGVEDSKSQARNTEIDLE